VPELPFDGGLAAESFIVMGRSVLTFLKLIP